ncbi:RNA polymerase sigma factor SigY [Paenibacillus agaridevorans]|uniref:RNA polymerase sigma factor SigY n=1 Tax=Paenibacillus agaridevorans TaxID=171404 RepID=A0A2R5EYM3_9BACL|nr:RNA polymerase sigma factor SigY [Paenibacillus agaridevorans]GBG11816.1 RNA polymerase sigma factor SigY [Paenibacillus agaridevorans]
MEDEPKLVQLAIRGDTGALSELLRRNYVFLYQYALKLTMDRNRAEDIVQETALKAIEHIALFQGGSKFSTWLITIASRLVIDKARRSKRERRWLTEERYTRGFRFEVTSRLDEWPDAVEALAGLPEHHRVPILLKYYYGYSQEEISEMLKVPTGTIKSRLHAGIRRLREELRGHEQ